MAGALPRRRDAARVRQSRDVLRDLATHSAALHGRIAREGLATGYRKTGLLNVFNSEKAFLDACDEALRDHAGGIKAEILSAAELSRVGPPLAAPSPARSSTPTSPTATRRRL